MKQNLLENCSICGHIQLYIGCDQDYEILQKLWKRIVYETLATLGEE